MLIYLFICLKQMYYLNARVSHFLRFIIVWLNTSFPVNICSDFTEKKHNITPKNFRKQLQLLQCNVLTNIALLTFTVYRFLCFCLLRRAMQEKKLKHEVLAVRFNLAPPGVNNLFSFGGSKEGV